MLDRLLESRHRSDRAARQMAISVGAHTAIVAIAVIATAHASPRSIEQPTRVVWPRAYVAPQHAAAAPSHTVVGHRPPSIWVNPRIEISVPGIPSLTEPAVDAREFAASLSIKSVFSAGPLGPSPGEPFRGDQVEKQAMLAPGNPAPAYPEQLRASGVEGEVTANFVIDTTGRAEPSSIQFALSRNVLFEASVRSALGRMHFIPAQVGGVKVRQLVQMPFVFTLNR